MLVQVVCLVELVGDTRVCGAGRRAYCAYHMAPSGPPLPGAALELFLFLQRIEAAVREASGPAGLHKSGGIVSSTKIEEILSEEEELWRAKIRAYQKTLLARLDQLDGIGEAAGERLRSRVEDLSLGLDKALGHRRASLAPAPQLPPQAKIFGAIVNSSAVVGAAGVNSATEVAPLAGGDKPPLAGSGTGSMPPLASTSSQREQLLGSSTARQRKGPSTAVARDVRGNLETEMVDLSEGMKGAANSFLATLKKDNKRLDDMSSSMQKNLDDVTAANEKGRNMMRSSQLSFFCTMIMVIVSVVIFFMMIPFIIIT